MINSHKAVFLDKDGVLNKDLGINPFPDKVEIFKYIPDTLKSIKKLGYKLVLVTNQPIVARGLISEEEVEQRLNTFNILTGSYFDLIMFCPHHPHADIKKYRINCPCRKPKPGMLENASKLLKIEFQSSFIAGDRMSDIVAGHMVGVKTVLITTGMHEAEPIITDLIISKPIIPDYQIQTLDKILNII